MNHEWQAYDHHDTLQCKLTESEQAELVKAYDAFYSRLDTFDDVVAEQKENNND